MSVCVYAYIRVSGPPGAVKYTDGAIGCHGAGGGAWRVQKLTRIFLRAAAAPHVRAAVTRLV